MNQAAHGVRALMLAALCALSACTPARPPAPSRLEPNQPGPEAQRILSDIDAHLAAISDRQRPPAERAQREEAFLSALEGWAPRVTGDGGKVENHVLFRLAQTRFALRAERGTQEVLSLLDQLDRSPKPIFKGESRLLRIRALLRRGQPRQAASEIEALRELVPDWEPLANRLIAFHGLVGATTPAVAGRVLHRADIPATATPWRIWLFIESIDDTALFRINEYLKVCGDGRRLRLSVVCFDESPVGLTPFTQLAHAAHADFVWAPDQAAVQNIISTWRLVEASAVLAGPDGTIMCCDTPASLAAALAAGRFVR